jgi:hypothetical protein
MFAILCVDKNIIVSVVYFVVVLFLIRGLLSFTMIEC